MPIDDLELYEVSTVLHAAHGFAHALSVKDGRPPAGLEVKAAALLGRGGALRGTPQQVLMCAVCGNPGALVTAGRLSPDSAAV